MTKILKKSLACLLVFVLCFTAIAGCLSVSAAAPAATFDYKTYFPNDNKVWAACAGQNVRAQLSMENLEAGATIGVSVEIPEGAEITSVDGWSVNTSCALSEVSSYFDEENSIFTIIYDVTVSGNYTLFVRYNITEEVAKKVHHMNAKFEAAFASDDEIKQITVTDYYEVFDHNVETLEAVAPGCETTGLTEGSHCSICGEVFVAQEEVAALGHAWDEGVVDPDATCTDEGVITYTCANDPSHTYTEAISAKGHTPADALVNNGDNHSVVCDVCGAVLETADHDYVDGTCACGAAEPAEGPIIDEEWALNNPSPGFGDNSLQIGFRARTTVFTKYNDVAIVIIPQKYDKTTLNYVENPEEIVIPYSTFSNGSGSFRTYYYTDILLYELGLNIDYKLRGTDAKGNTVESVTNTTSIANYLRTMVPADDYMATLVADTLIVGQSAMENMSADYPDSQLYKDAQATITEGYDLSAATQSFDMESCNKVNVHNATNENFGTASSCANQVRYGCSIDAAPTLSYRIKGLRSLDVNKFAFHITYTQINADGSEKNYDETITYASNPEKFSGLTGNYLTFTFDELGLPAGNVTVNCVATYDGAEVFNSQYSVETYFYNNISTLNEKLQVLATNVLKLGVSFRANASKNN